MEFISTIYLLPIAYIIGSIPTSVWIGKIFYHTDVREYGSKNAGATNTIRVLGYKAGIPVFIIDALKGYFAVYLIHFFNNEHFNASQILIFQLLLGISAILGHIFPVFAQFKGGKGVATLLGIFLCITIYPTLISLAVFFVVLFITKYVSVGSVSAGIVFPISVFFLFPESPAPLKIASIVITFLILLTHKKNIVRLIKGEENKFGSKKTDY